MNDSTNGRFELLESEVERNPKSEAAHEDLLIALSEDTRQFHSPRRFEIIEWFLQNNPRRYLCSTPYMQVDPKRAPVPYRNLKARWVALVSEAPADSALVRGAAAFVAAESLDEARSLLQAAIALKPDDAKLWLDLGRASRDPRERLTAFERSREAGGSLPNLLVWIATAAVEAGEYEKAEGAARELMQLVDEARSRFGEALDWPEPGAALWRRAREACASDSAAEELTDAIAEHAYRKHWAHTALGLLACRNDDLDQAVSHLRASADVRPDYRLSSYGPSLDLVREVCVRDRWNEGLEYLRAWEETWDDPRLRGWIAAVKEHQLPETPRDSS